jgi:hypothetical protein
MIRVQDRQMDAIGKAVALEQFEDEMVVHLHGFAAKHAEAIGDDWVRRAIRLGIERASVYGVTNPGLLKFYVELMFMFGGMFDTDPLQPWAGRILRDASIPDEATRMDRLYDATLEYVDTVDGPERDYSLQALRNVKRILREDTPAAELVAPERALDLMARIYPERCAHLGEAPLLGLVHRSAELAQSHRMGTDRGAILVIGMAFAMGHGFAEDPLYPWVGSTLRNPTISTAERRVDRLERRLSIYLDRALAYFEGKQAGV